MDSATPNKFLTYSMIEQDKGLLLEIPCHIAPPGGHRTIGTRRSSLHKAAVDTAMKQGVEIHWDHKLVDLQQQEGSVTVRFENGAEDTGSFVVGTDGLHSGTRICLFGEEKADYTGLAQVWSLMVKCGDC
jgi:salicylate hydroxylase